MATQQEVIKKFMASLDKTTLKGTEAVDEAIKACSNFKSLDEVINKMCSDCNSTTADNFLKNYCGIILGNADTGAITGSDAGGSKVKTAESIVPEGSTAKAFTGNSFTVNELTVKLGGNFSSEPYNQIYSRDYSTLSNYEKYLWNNLHEYWIKGGLNLIAESYGDNFSFTKNEISYNDVNKPTTKTLYIDFFRDASNSNSAETCNVFNSDEGELGIATRINFYYYGDVTGVNGEPHAKPWNPYLDRTIAHELTHAVMRANIQNFDNLPAFIKEGTAELTHGVDDDLKTSIETLAGNSSRLKQALSTSTGTVSISGISSPSYAGGYMFLRYLAKQASSSTVADSINTIDNRRSNISVTGSAGKDSIYSNGSNVTINVLGGNDTVSNFGSNVKIYGGAGNDSLYSHSNKSSVLIDTGAGNNYVRNFSSNVTILGSDGKDTIYNDDDCNKATIKSGAGNDSVRNIGTAVTIDLGAGNDSLSNENANVTISGGKGDDYIYNYSSGKNVLFKYASGDGNDKIIGFNATSTLSISGGYSSQKSGSNIIFTVGNGHITLQGAGNLSKVNVKSNVNSPTEGNDSISNTTSGAIIKTLGGNDTIRNYAKNVSIDAGKGNDDVYNYSVSSGSSIKGSENNDYILNFADKVKIYGGDGDDTISNSNFGYLDGKSISTGNVANSVTIDAGNGKDSIENTGSKASILGGAGNDYIRNSGASVTIDGGLDNDSIYNYKGNTKIYGGDGNDYITNASLASSVTISGGNGNDSIYNTFNAGTKISIDGGAGKDYIYNWGDNNTILGGSDNDTIYSSASNVKIFGGTGNDSLQNYNGKNVVFNYASGDGNDTIVGFNATSTLSISSGTYTSQKSGSDIFVTVGNGKLTLTGAANLSKVNIAGTKTATLLTVTNSTKSPVTVGSSIKVIDASKRTTAVKITGNSLANTIKGGSKNDSLYGAAGNDSILGNTGNDYLDGGNGNDSLSGGEGHDTIYGGNGDDSIGGGKGTDKIYGGKGKDSILGNEGNDIIYGGADNDILFGHENNDKLYGETGNDKLYGGTGNDTLSGGKGNDSLWGDAGKDTFLYADGDGNDVIYNFANDDLLKITGAFSTNYNKSKKEVYFKVGSTANAITLKNYSATTFNVNNVNYKLGSSSLVKK